MSSLNSIEIMEVLSFMRKVQTFPKDWFPNFFVDVKSTNSTQKRICTVTVASISLFAVIVTGNM